ncbi:DNA repair protein RecO [Chloroflexota bacterium]
MTRPRVYKTEAVVFKRTRFGEADGILTLYTPYLGKFQAVAKGVNRPGSKLGGHVEILNHSMLMLAQGRNLDIITQSQTLNGFLPLRSDLWRTSCALYVAELTDCFTAEHISDPPIFELLLDTLHRLCQAKDDGLVLRYFELHLLDHLGYRPQLHQCPGCHCQLEPVTNSFSPSAGGVLCPNCSSSEAATRPLSTNALKVLRLFQRSEYANASQVRVNRELSSELERLMREYIRYLLEREMKSNRWLDRLRREGIGKSAPILHQRPPMQGPHLSK